MKLKIAKYKDVKDIPIIDNGEVFVFADKFDTSIKIAHVLKDMLPYFDGRIVVRETVAKMLADANKILNEKGLGISIAYGLRLLEIQTMYYNRRREVILKERPEISEEDLQEEAHTMTAVPDVAGHPTGGAVDVKLYDLKTGNLLDMGGEISDFSNKKYLMFAEGLSEKQKQNRKILHDAMKSVGFCPYYGEWWHYSYGDREWAFFYDKENAIYDQKQKEEVIIQ